MAQWFWLGLVGWLFGGLLLLAATIGGDPSLEGLAMAGLIFVAGQSAMLVGVIGQGVRLGVNAANEDD